MLAVLKQVDDTRQREGYREKAEVHERERVGKLLLLLPVLTYCPGKLEDFGLHNYQPRTFNKSWFHPKLLKRDVQKI